MAEDAKGPSKSAQKKAAKAASKQDKKAAASGAPNGPSELSFWASSEVDAVKVLAAAAICSAEAVKSAATNPAGSLSFAGSCVLGKGTALVFGASACCKYFGYACGGTAGDAVAVDSAIEWADSCGGDAAGLLSGLEARLASGALIAGTELSIADAVVAPAAAAALGGDGAAKGSHPLTAAYVEKVMALPQFTAAVTQAKALVQQCSSKNSSSGGSSSGAGGSSSSSSSNAECSVEGLSLFTGVQKLFTVAIATAFPQLDEPHEAIITRCDYKFGDFQCNSAMNLYPKLKSDSINNPRKVAQAIQEAMPRSTLIDSITLSGAAFLNVRLHSSKLIGAVRSTLTDGPRAPPLSKRLKVAVDFSSPNIAKEMHVGHLRSTIIGDTISRILEFCGHEVLRVNHVGDWGTQFGMLINYMKTEYPNFLTDPPNITDLTVFYKGAKQAFDASEEFKEASRRTVVSLQSGDAECLKVWEMLCHISRGAFQQVYDRLNVKLDECGESFYNKRIPGTLEQMDKAGVLKVEEGATVCMLDGFTYPLIVKKSDGGYGYDSTDCAAVNYRLNELKCDWIIYVTDSGQFSHFDMVFQAAAAVGWVQEHNRLVHVGFGVVQGEDGKKFKSRSGDTVRLVDLLDAAVKRMHSELTERVANNKSSLSPEQVDHAAAAIGYGAVKYFDLKQSPPSAYIFSYDRMLDTRGNTAVYLQYAHARLCSILTKAQQEQGVDVQALKASDTPIILEHSCERALAFELMQFTTALEDFMKDLMPNRLCDHLYALATRFSDFVTNCRVLGSEEQSSRLLMCEATGITMRTAMTLLGLTPLHQI